MLEVTIGTSLILASEFGTASEIWLEVVERRIDDTSAVIHHIKCVKALGASRTVTKWSQELKVLELNRSGKYRKLLTTIMGLGQLKPR
jgi:hypothetical protein